MSQGNGSRDGLTLEFPPEFIYALADAVRERLEFEGVLGHAAPDILTVGETAQYMRCTRQAVYDRVHQGAIEPLRDGRRLLFRRAALDAYLEGRQT
jgi:excisionase family DNA binding protein